jgi:hypothetical protein
VLRGSRDLLSYFVCSVSLCTGAARRRDAFIEVHMPVLGIPGATLQILERRDWPRWLCPAPVQDHIGAA